MKRGKIGPTLLLTTNRKLHTRFRLVPKLNGRIDQSDGNSVNENRRTDLDSACSNKGEKNGDHVDGQLELEELRDVVVDVPSPHHRLYDAREVVVSQHDVRCLLRHVRTRDTLQTTNVAQTGTRHVTSGAKIPWGSFDL